MSASERLRPQLVESKLHLENEKIAPSEGCRSPLSHYMRLFSCEQVPGDGAGGIWLDIRIVIIFRKRLAGVSSSTLERFVLQARRLVGMRETVSIVISASHELRLLNRRFRGLDKPTDVLSFPAGVAAPRGRFRSAGDVVISADIARDNAKRFGHSAAVEVKILILHGILHLAGFDHERDRGEMARRESQLRRKLNLETGLIERTGRDGVSLSAGGRGRSVLRGKRRVA
jgi:probable rRNA maturation factor